MTAFFIFLLVAAAAYAVANGRNEAAAERLEKELMAANQQPPLKRHASNAEAFGRTFVNLILTFIGLALLLFLAVAAMHVANGG